MQYPDYDATADIEVINSNTKKLVQNAEEQDEVIKGKEPKITRTDVPENNSQKVFSALGALNLKNWLVTNYTTLMNNIRDSLTTLINGKLSHGGYEGTGQTLFDLIESAKTSLISLINSNTSKLETLERKCLYRIGDVLTTLDKEHPALTWQGTTWEKIEAAFLRGTEVGQEAGVTGGSNSITLKIGNLPPHNHPVSVILANAGIHRHLVDNHIHAQPQHYHMIYGGAGGYLKTLWEARDVAGIAGGGSGTWINKWQQISHAGGENTGGSAPYTNSEGDHNHAVTASCTSIGSGEAINIMPRYYTVHYWKRVS